MPLQPGDVQGNIFPGFKKDHQAFLFVRFPGSIPDLSAQAWLSEIRHSVAAADEVQAFNALDKIVSAHRPPLWAMLTTLQRRLQLHEVAET